MPDEVAIAAPSAAEVAVSEPIDIPRSNTPEYAEWRKSGALPQSSEAKTVEPPATDTPKAETAVDPEPAAGKQQESRRKPDAEARIAELTAKLKQREQDLEEARKPKEAKADPPPARQPEVSPEPQPEDKNDDGTPKYVTYEAYVKALARHMAQEMLTERDRTQAQAKQLESTTQKLTEARTRYEDYDSKAMPVVTGLLKEGVSREVFAVLNDSPVLADLLYAIGGDEKTMADFLTAAETNPSKALRVALLMEQTIQQELAKGSESSKSTERNDKGQFVPKEETPAKRGPESAPSPPIEIGSRGGIPKEADPSATGDFRAFMRQRNAEDLKRQRGA